MNRTKIMIDILLMGVIAAVVIFGSVKFFDTFWNQGVTNPRGLEFHIFVDVETGCQYIAKQGITPRLNKAGQHMGCSK